MVQQSEETATKLLRLSLPVYYLQGIPLSESIFRVLGRFVGAHCMVGINARQFHPVRRLSNSEAVVVH
jgi:hypothetical protein